MNQILGNTIARLRKEKGLTQEQLASELNISYQAVSKWENGVSSPDLSNIKRLAEIFDVSIDELFGLTVQAEREELAASADLSDIKEAKPETEQIADEAEACQEDSQTVLSASFRTQKIFDLPWEDDNTLRVVAFRGTTLLSATEIKRNFLTRNNIVIQYSGDVDNLYSHFDVSCGKVYGHLTAEGDVKCEDVMGNVNAGGDVACDKVDGSVQAGGDVSCGDVGLDVRAGGDVDCDGIAGNVSAGGDVDSGDIGGNVTAAGDVDCGSVIGNVSAEGDVDCGRIGGTMKRG